MSNVTLALTLLISAVLVGVAFFTKKSWLRIIAVIVLYVALLLREFSFGSYARRLISDTAFRGDLLDQYRNGIDAVANLYSGTAVYTIVVGALLIILTLRGLDNPSR